MNYLKNIGNWFKTNIKPISNDTLKVVVLCVFTATTFWVFNALNDNYTTAITYPINLNYNSEKILPTTELPESVRINVSGGGWNLLRKTFWFNIPAVEVEIENPTQRKYFLGSALYQTVANQVTDIELNYVDTDTLWINLDSIASKTVAVYADSASIPIKEGYSRTSPVEVSIDSATFTGPKENISQIPNPLLLFVGNDSIDSDYKEDIFLPTFGSNLVNRNPVEATISFKVEALIDVELELPYSLIQKTSDSMSFQFADSLVGVNFTITEDIQDRIPLDSILIEVNMSTLAKKDSKVVPKVVAVPEALSSTDMKIDSVSYSYQK